MFSPARRDCKGIRKSKWRSAQATSGEVRVPERFRTAARVFPIEKCMAHETSQRARTHFWRPSVLRAHRAQGGTLPSFTDGHAKFPKLEKKWPEGDQLRTKHLVIGARCGLE